MTEWAQLNRTIDASLQVKIAHYISDYLEASEDEIKKNLESFFVDNDEIAYPLLVSATKEFQSELTRLKVIKDTERLAPKDFIKLQAKRASLSQKRAVLETAMRKIKISRVKKHDVENGYLAKIHDEIIKIRELMEARQ